MKPSLALLPALLFGISAHAQENEIISPDVAAAMQESNETMVKSVEQMNETLVKMIPEISQAMTSAMSNVMNSITPVMEAMEKDKTFSKISKQINNDIAKSMEEAQISASPDHQSSVSIQGAQTTDDKSLNFAISPDETAVSEAFALLNNKSAPGKTTPQTVKTLNKQDIPLEKFNIIAVNNSSFLAYDNQSKQYTFLNGNLHSGANLKVEAFGPGHQAKARAFAASLNYMPAPAQTVPAPQQAPKKISIYPVSR